MHYRTAGRLLDHPDIPELVVPVWYEYRICVSIIPQMYNFIVEMKIFIHEDEGFYYIN